MSEFDQEKAAEKIKALIRKMIIGDIISKSQLIACSTYLVRQSEKSERSLYTVTWYDYNKKESGMTYVRCDNSIEAISNAGIDMEVCTEIAAYPIKLPEKMKFIPDNEFKKRNT
jgi:hypothetical protein